jgi:hypothetical protein
MTSNLSFRSALVAAAAFLTLTGCAPSDEIAPGGDDMAAPAAVTVDDLSASLLTVSQLGAGWVTAAPAEPFETAPTAGCPGPQLVSPSFTNVDAGLSVYSTSAPACGPTAVVLDVSATTLGFYEDLYSTALAASAAPAGLEPMSVTVSPFDTGSASVVGFTVQATLRQGDQEVGYAAVLLRAASSTLQLDAHVDSYGDSVDAALIASLVRILAGQV